ncbi:hypothetical protein [Mycobacterium xenopi]|uniref:CDGP domain-containing protein n=1 Tax=Mycobacterium xenopi TaxID=1789 RepID=A0AAD1M1D0_MYCXE|nr:hypothetical protein [Mycobacterium xenopi]MDA3640193.1 hypothetical protein [Mycobacterium xenopi]MDA3658494.1 hypothetical protein [Mycobacterium xenopi]MDA3662481.1 hypothetical protein [Mycobacterium xenopi]ORX19479.1 hypothetical protein AWC32_10325 [Mycobacterium xenopi]SPX92724.1 Uncharacterised protein [Mycobacterium xenopi]
MKGCIIAGAAALLMAASLVVSAPSARAGCLYGGPVLGKCDGPVQPDGSWQRCVVVTRLVPSGLSSYLVPDRHCELMGPDQHPWDPAFAYPPAHIDD